MGARLAIDVSRTDGTGLTETITCGQINVGITILGGPAFKKARRDSVYRIRE